MCWIRWFLEVPFISRENESLKQKKKKKKGEWEKRKESEEAGVMKSQLANAPEDKVRLLEMAVEYF